MTTSRDERGRRREPRQGRSRALVSAVVEATLDLLVRSESLSIKSIADRAGVGAGSIYEYFTDRDGVVDAVVERITRENFAEMEREILAGGESEPLEQLFERGLDRMIALYTERGELTRVAIRTLLRFGRAEAITAERDRFVERLAIHVGDRLGMPVEEVLPTLRAVTDRTMGVLVSELDRPPSPERLAAHRATLVRVIRAETAQLRARSAASTGPSATNR